MRKKLAFGMILAALAAAPTMTSMAGEWVEVNGSYWYRNDDGSAHTGWLLDNGKWYFMDRQTCYMKTGWVLDGGKWYFCNDDGSMYPNGWLDLDGKRYYINSDGSMAVGSFMLDSYWYRTEDDGSLIRSRTRAGLKYDSDGRVMVRDEYKDWIYLLPTEVLSAQSEARLRERYLDHEYANKSEFENAVRETFSGIWSEQDIKYFIADVDAEFQDTYDTTYNAYRE